MTLSIAWTRLSFAAACAGAALGFAPGCSSSDATSNAAAGAGADSGPGTTTASQTPPTGGTSVEAWLATGAYKSWKCEDAVHAARSPSPHGFNRICSNDVISAHATDTSATPTWASGAAAVKELYASATATTPVGYAVYLKQNADSAGGANWYWYERVPADSEAPHDANGVVADGTGGADAGPPNTICVACHAGAGTNAAHTPSTGSRDFVYTPVAD